MTRKGWNGPPVTWYREQDIWRFKRAAEHSTARFIWTYPTWARNMCGIPSPGMTDRCREVGFDLTTEPVKVSPTAHFHMGGATIDVECRTNIEGLFVAGEDAGGVHGANRLGGNGVAESTVFGRLAGTVMAEYVATKSIGPISEIHIPETISELSSCMDSGGSENVFSIRKDLENLMWDNVGLVRDEAGLKVAMSSIEELSVRHPAIYCASRSRVQSWMAGVAKFKEHARRRTVDLRERADPPRVSRLSLQKRLSGVQRYGVALQYKNAISRIRGLPRLEKRSFCRSSKTRRTLKLEALLCGGTHPVNLR